MQQLIEPGSPLEGTTVPDIGISTDRVHCSASAWVSDSR
jgi:hypothetical protein